MLTIGASVCDRGGIWELSGLSAQFFCKHQSALKIKSIDFLRNEKVNCILHMRNNRSENVMKK